jgi:hypothetical protein
VVKAGGNGATTVTGVVNNTGSVEIQAGVIQVGSKCSFGPEAKLSLSIGGGTVGAGLSQLQVAGSATLDGTLAIQLVNGFVPNVGDQLQVVAGPCTGGLANLSIIDAASQRVFLVKRQGDGVWLHAEDIAGPELELRPLGVGGGQFQMLFSGTPGLDYTIQASQDLVNWTKLLQIKLLQETVEVRDAAAGYRFYRASQP